MIAMVCVSVISTGIVMHISGISQPMPKWIKRIFLDIIPRCLCLSSGEPRDNEKREIIQVSSQRQDDNSDTVRIVNGSVKVVKEVESSAEAGEHHSETADLLRFMKLDIDTKNRESVNQWQWKRLSIVIDRILLYLFTLFTVLCTLIICIQLITGSSIEFDKIEQELEEQWS